MSEQSTTTPSNTTNEERGIVYTGLTVSRETFQRDYVIVREGDSRIPVANVSAELPVINKEGEEMAREDGTPLMKHIINFKAIPASKQEEVKELFADRDEVDLGELRGITMSFNAIVPDKGSLDLPFKGQWVKTSARYITNSNDEVVLVIAQMAVPAVAKAEAFNFDTARAIDDTVSNDEAPEV